MEQWVCGHSRGQEEERAAVVVRWGANGCVLGLELRCSGCGAERSVLRFVSTQEARARGLEPPDRFRPTGAAGARRVTW